MSKLFKGLIIVVFALVVLAALAIFLIANNMGEVIKRGVNDYSEQIVGVPMQVGNVDVDLLAGRAALSDFVIANPVGFSDANSFELKNIELLLDIKSLRSDVIVIEKIVIVGASILAEQIDTRINLNVLKNKISAHTASSSKNKNTNVAETNTSKSTSDQPKIAIAYFEFSDANAQVKSNRFSEQKINIPAITLNNIGTKAEGITLNNAANAILQPLMARIIEEVQRQAIKNSANKIIEKELDKIGAKEKLKGFLNKL